jgi:hypothetical protein
MSDLGYVISAHFRLPTSKIRNILRGPPFLLFAASYDDRSGLGSKNGKIKEVNKLLMNWVIRY